MAERNPSPPIRMVLGFFAGFIAVWLFQQPVLAFLHGVGLAGRPAYSMDYTMPLGVPYVWSRAFWGGVWGVVLAMVDTRFPAGARYWLWTAIFGAIAPTALAWLLALASTGQPVGGDWTVGGFIASFLMNALWAIGTVLLIYAFDAAVEYQLKV